MIQKVSFRNFKAYRSLDLDLDPLTVLVGPNASGKTTLLQGLHLAASVAGGAEKRSASLVERGALNSYGLTAPIELGLAGVWEREVGTIRITYEGKPGPRPWDVQWTPSNSQNEPVDEIKERVPGKIIIRSKNLNAVPSNLRELMGSTSILRFEAQSLAKASYSEKPVPEVDASGDGLASALAYLKLSQDEVFGEIEQALNQIVPSVQRIRIERAPIERTTFRTVALDEQRHRVPEKQKLWGDKVVLDMLGAKGVSADSTGEGTLMVLGLLTVLMGPKRPRLVLLDDIELGLHPLAQGRLIETLRKLQTLDSELQIIATSHSPFVLNYLRPEEVRMTFLLENGFARCEKLTAHPEFDRWKDLMSPGEFWSTVGESWVGTAPEKP